MNRRGALAALAKAAHGGADGAKAVRSLSSGDRAVQRVGAARSSTSPDWLELLSCPHVDAAASKLQSGKNRSVTLLYCWMMTCRC